jgi:hypothetical protein
VKEWSDMSIRRLLFPLKQENTPAFIGTRAKQCTTTHRNKTVNVNKIKHIFIVLVLPTKSMF